MDLKTYIGFFVGVFIIVLASNRLYQIRKNPSKPAPEKWSVVLYFFFGVWILIIAVTDFFGI
jgi:phosphatidylglycerophosphate synthase